MFIDVILFTIIDKRIDYYTEKVYINTENILSSDIKTLKVTSALRSNDKYNMYFIMNMNKVIQSHYKITRDANVDSKLTELIYWLKDKNNKGLNVYAILSKIHLN